MELVTIASATAAVGFLAGGATRLALSGWRRASTALRQHDFQARMRSELRQQATHARLAGQARWQSTQSNHSEWRVMEVVEVVDESQDVRSFYLRDPLQISPLPNYLPGQCLIVRPALGGADLPARCYSLSDAPGQNWYRISVKRQIPSRGEAPGLSSWLHDHIHTGDCLLINGPHGEFVIDASVRAEMPIVLLAAGVGVTPILSMLKSLLVENPRRQVSVFLQAQDTQHWPFGELIHSWAKQCPNLKPVTFFSRVEAEQLPVVKGGTVHSGRLTSETIGQSLSQPVAAHYYMCGPDIWMKSMETGLSNLGVPSAQIHFESFASDRAAATDQSVQPWSIHFERSGLTTPSSEQAANILDAASQQGLNLPAVCRNGVCGSCKVKLLKGTVNYAKRPACSHHADEAVACLAQPVGDIVVDA